MECPLCLEPEPDTRYEHPLHGVCTGFDVHATCLATYIHNHLTQHTNFVCTTCRLDLRETPLQLAQRRVQLAERRVQLARQRIEEYQPFRTGYMDLFLVMIGGHSLIQIVVTGDLHHFLPLGVCTIYAYSRVEPYLRRRIQGGTRKHRRKLGPNELAIIQVRHPTESLLHQLEREMGPARIIHLQDASNTAGLFE